MLDKFRVGRSMIARFFFQPLPESITFRRVFAIMLLVTAGVFMTMCFTGYRVDAAPLFQDGVELVDDGDFEDGVWGTSWYTSSYGTIDCTEPNVPRHSGGCFAFPAGLGVWDYYLTGSYNNPTGGSISQNIVVPSGFITVSFWQFVGGCGPDAQCGITVTLCGESHSSLAYNAGFGWSRREFSYTLWTGAVCELRFESTVYIGANGYPYPLAIDDVSVVGFGSWPELTPTPVSTQILPTAPVPTATVWIPGVTPQPTPFYNPTPILNLTAVPTVNPIKVTPLPTQCLKVEFSRLNIEGVGDVGACFAPKDIQFSTGFALVDQLFGVLLGVGAVVLFFILFQILRKR